MAVKRASSAPASASSAVGVRPYASRHASFSAGCSETWACSGAPSRRAALTRRTAATSREPGSTARTLWIAAPMRAWRGAALERAHTLGPRVGGAVGKRTWAPSGGCTDPAVQVARVDQRDAGCRPRRRPAMSAWPIAFGSSYGRAVRPVVQVVELAHRRDAGQRHLGEGRAREREVGVGVEPLGERVHLLAPGPERAAPGAACARAARAGTRASGRWRGRAA